MKHSIFGLIKEFVIQNPIIILIVLSLNLLHYLKSIVIPKNISDLIITINDNDSTQIKKLLFITLLQIIGMLIGMSIHGYINYRMHDLIQKFHLNKLFKSLLENRITKIDEKILPSVYSSIITYTNSINNMVTSFFLIIPILVTIFGLAKFIYGHHKKSFLFFSFTLLICLGYLIYSGLKMKEKSIIYNRSRDELIDLNDDINSNVLNILSFNKIEDEKTRISNKIDQYLNNFKKYHIFKILFFESFSLSITLMLSIILIVFYNKLILGTMTKKQFAQAISIFVSFMISTLKRDIQKISILFYKYGRSKICLDNINKYYVDKRIVLNESLIKKNSNDQFIFNLINVSYSLNSNNIFDNFNIKILRSQFTCICGHIGSGKSTLINLLFGVKHIDTGKILLNGIDVKNLSIDDWRKDIHYCSQNPILFNRTIEQNILYGNKDLNHNLIKIIDYLNINNLMNKLFTKKGEIGQKGYKLSCGERRIISLLRIAINPKPIIILDEPTSSLDEFYRNIVYKLIDFIKSKNNVSLIIVTHDNDLINKADRLIKLKEGKIIEDLLLKKNYLNKFKKS